MGSTSVELGQPEKGTHQHSGTAGFDLPCKGYLKGFFDCRALREVPPRHLIYSQGEAPQTMYLVCSGLVKLTRTESDGKRVIVGLRRKGWVLGAGSLLLNVRYETGAETISRSRLCAISAATFLRAMGTDPGFSRWVTVMLSEALRRSMVAISEQCCLSGRQRLEKFLWEIARDQYGSEPGAPLKLQMILKNWEIAQLLALTPQHLCRLIRRLEDEGLVQRNNGWLILPEPEKLWHPENPVRDLL